MEKFKEKVGNLKDKLVDFKDNIKNKFQKEKEEIEKYNQEIADLEEQKELEEDTVLNNLSNELNSTTNDKVLELELRNQDLELNLNDLQKLSEEYNLIAKNRIKETFLWFSVKGIKNKTKFETELRNTNILEIANLVGFGSTTDELYKKYIDEYYDEKLLNNRTLFSEKAKTLNDNNKYEELQNMGMGTGQEILVTINSNNEKILKLQKDILDNKELIKTLTGSDYENVA